MAGKIQKLEGIIKKICAEKRIQKKNIILKHNPARIYFVLDCDEQGNYVNLEKDMQEIFKIAKKYKIVRDKSKPKYQEDGRVAFSFKLIGVKSG